MKTRTLVLLSDGMPVKVFLVPEDKVTDESMMAIHAMCQSKGLVLHNIIPDEMETMGDVGAAIMEESDSYEYKTPPFLDQMSEGLKPGELAVIPYPRLHPYPASSLVTQRMMEHLQKGGKVLLTTMEMSPTGRSPSGPELQNIRPELTAEQQKLVDEVTETVRKMRAGGISIDTSKLNEIERKIYEEKYGIVTGRMSCSKSNMANIPRTQEEGAARYSPGEIKLAAFDHCNLMPDDTVRFSDADVRATLDAHMKLWPQDRTLGESWISMEELAKRGWDHFGSPFEIQALDMSDRFTGPDRNEKAAEAHRNECGCGWPDHDYYYSISCYLTDLEMLYDDDDEKMPKELKEFASLLENRCDFFDGIKNGNIIAACTRMVDTLPEPQKGMSICILKIIKECRDNPRFERSWAAYADDWSVCGKCDKPYVSAGEGKCPRCKS